MPPKDSIENRLIVHELPSAPKFIGRDPELESLRDFWSGSDQVVSLIGLGGAGKTALADRFLNWVESNDAPDWLLVWSFYDDPDANAFLETLYRFLTGDQQAEVKGSGWFHLLREELSGTKRVLLILDGLERVQRPITDASGIYGDLEDPLLKGLLTRLASSGGRTKAVITSRFPVATVEPYLGRGYQVLNVEQLPNSAVKDLMALRGIHLDDLSLARFVSTFGSHALSLDLLAGAIENYFDRNVESLPPFSSNCEPAATLAYVLKIYEERLPVEERDILSRLCVFRFGVDAHTLHRVFLSSQNEALAGSLAGLTEAQIDELVDRLIDRHLVYRESHNKYTVHPAVRDHFYRLFRDPSDVHGAIAKHFGTLAQRPGIGLPTDKESLDLLEELIHHATQAKSISEAVEIYFSRLGGNDHLNGTLGEYARTYRILSTFPECPDPSAMYHSERAFGNLEQALHWRPKNHYILLLAGKLKELSTDGSDATRAMALSLMGKDAAIPERSPDFPVCSAMAYLFKGEIDTARRLAENEIAISGYEDDRVRNQLALAECYRLNGRISEAKALVDRASEWILQSASQEHLSSLQLGRANIALEEANYDSARFAMAEGLQVAQEAGFRLHECLFRLAEARMAELMEDYPAIMEAAGKALEIAQSCSFEYGRVRAAHYLETYHLPALAAERTA
jgi:hypothetical protein